MTQIFDKCLSQVQNKEYQYQRAGFIDWTDCDNSKIEELFETNDAKLDQNFGALWLGNRGFEKSWDYPVHGSFMESLYASNQLDKFHKSQKNPECKTECRYLPSDGNSTAKICTPNLVLAGTYKGASTFLFSKLAEHPQILPPLGGTDYKEPGIFLKNFEHKWGEHAIYDRLAFIDKNENFINGEGTVFNMYQKHAIAKIFELNPNTKSVISLRNPVHRAYSQYRYAGSKKFTYEEQVMLDLNRWNSCIGEMNLSIPQYFSHSEYMSMERNNEDREKWIDTYFECAKSHQDNIATYGLYIFPILHYVSVFGRDQVSISDSADYEDEEKLKNILNGITSFLELCSFDDFEVEFLKEKKNVNKKEKQVNEEVLNVNEMLYNFYKPYNQWLYYYLGRDLGWENDDKI